MFSDYYFVIYCRQVIYETIITLYGSVVKQIQESLKPFIVPAILDHDEAARGKGRLILFISINI